MSTVIDYLRWYQESDATMDTAELAVAYAKHCLSEELREVFAIHKAEIDALKAAQQWQPIESAPKDGVTRVLVLIREGTEELIQTVAVRDTSNGCWISSWTGEVLYPPTHWQPLPPPPEAIAKARGDL